MKKPKKSTFFQGDQNPFVAEEALRKGEEIPLAYYLADLAQGLSLLANNMHDPATEQSQIKITPPDNVAPALEYEEEWEASLEQFERAISSNDHGLVTSYLRDASGILNLVARALKAQTGAKHWKLEFKRGRGRPADDQWEKLQKESAIQTALKFRTKKYGKQEAAIVDIQSEKSVSRATIFRAKSSKETAKKVAKKTPKTTTKKPTNKSKSHKKP